MTVIGKWEKDPHAVLDYKFLWSDWLGSGEVITTKTVTADTGLTIDSSSITDDGESVTVWLSGGTVGEEYRVTCHIETSASREDDRSRDVIMINR